MSAHARLSRLATGCAVVAVSSLVGCGAGTAAAVAGGGSDSGGNAPPSMSGFTVLNPKEPAQARVRFVLSDVEANPAEVELFFQEEGEDAVRITRAGANPAMLATSRDGIEHTLPWNFAEEPDLPDDARFVDDVRVFARVAGGIQEIVLGANGSLTGLGNDAPVVTDVVEPTSETSGIVLVECTVEDSSNDVVSVQVEYDIVGDDPDVGWQRARPAGEESTPEFAIRDVVVDANGTELRFFWDTNVDLAELEHDVRVRFAAKDPVVLGGGVESAQFRVDNNEEPIATISGDLVVTNPDQRRGIPIPFAVRDEESDEVRVVFQWKRPEQRFPDLPDTPAGIESALADRDQRRQLQICSQYATWSEGRVVPLDPTSVRLPELSASASSVLAHGLVGRELEIMRASAAPNPVAVTWATNPLDGPVAAIPVGDGIEAVVLDRASVSTWRLRQIDLATGVMTRELVSTATGEPDAMAMDRDSGDVLVASSSVGVWRVDRVSMESGVRSTLIESDGSTARGAVRGIAILGSNSALLTVASSLLRVDYADLDRVHSSVIFDDLATPWGVAVDPFAPNRAFVAERDAVTTSGTGRVALVDIEHRTIETLTIGARGSERASVTTPKALTFDRRRDRLLVVQDPGPPEEARVVAVDVGSAIETASYEVSPRLPAGPGGIETGGDGSIIVVLTDDLAVGGGVEQRRRIERFELHDRSVGVSSPFAPPLSALQRFRILEDEVIRRASPSGARGTFHWDSADLPGGGPVQFRVVPMDAEVGIEATTDAVKSIRAGFGEAPLLLGTSSATNDATAVAARDLDGDGDLDLVSTNADGDALTVLFQTAPGAFDGAPLSLSSPFLTRGPVDVTAADVDGDGDLDIVSANALNDNLTIFSQTDPGSFTITHAVGDSSVSDGPAAVLVADVDGDGAADLVSANAGTDNFTIFFRTMQGGYGLTPVSLGDRGVTSAPSSVAAADLDGDGDVDLACASFFSDELALYFQTSPRVFETTPLLLGDPGMVERPTSIAAADLDGDGDIDLVSASSATHRLRVFLQSDPGVFTTEPLFVGSAAVSTNPNSVVASDVDGDGDLDLVTANRGNDTLSIFVQSHSGAFDSRPVVLGDPTLTHLPAAAIAADIDGDGHVDIASANEFTISSTGTSALTIFFQDDAGNFGSSPLALGSAGSTPSHRSVNAIDMDADGDLDLCAASMQGHKLTVFIQVSPGVFDSTPMFVGGPSITSLTQAVAAGDLDGDGDADLVSANLGGNRLTVFFQTSRGVFDPVPLSLGGPGVTQFPTSVVCADLDRDGDLDIASANRSSNTVTLFFQIRPGVFDTSPRAIGGLGVTNGVRNLVAADLDGDGDVDLASANESSHTLTVFFQIEPGAYSEVPVTLGSERTTRQPWSIHAGDFDGDGTLDVASANAGSNTLTVFFQQSPGTFATTPVIVGGPAFTRIPRAITSADVDRDGDLDLISANENSATLTIFHQTSPRVFTPTPVEIAHPTLTVNPNSVVAADIDSDGDVDLIGGNGGGALLVYWNSH